MHANGGVATMQSAARCVSRGAVAVNNSPNKPIVWIMPSTSYTDKHWAAALGLALCLIPILTPCTVAQTYRFERDSAAYQPLAPATISTVPIGDTVYQEVIELPGETFRFFEQPFSLQGNSAVQITSTGTIRVDAETRSTVIDAFFGLLVTRDSSSAIAYHIDGEPGDRVLKVEYRNAGHANAGPGEYANVQAWLYQRSGVIEFRFGPGNMPSLSGGASVWCGACLVPPEFNAMFAKCWIGGQPDAPRIDTSHTVRFDRLLGLPPAGTVYRLTPRAVADAPARGGLIPSAPMLHPNPTTGIVTVAGGAVAHAGDVALVEDLLGNIVLSAPCAGPELTLDARMLPPGTYVVSVVAANGRRGAGQLLVKR